MWIILLIVLMAAAAVHSRLAAGKSRTPPSELFLVYLLAGYCGIAPIITGLALFVAPPDWQIALMPRAQPGNPLTAWFAVLWLGMGAIGTLTIWLRGVYLVAPMVGWSIFWGGATFAHAIHDPTDAHPLTAVGFTHIFIAHGLIAILLVAFGVVSWRGRRQTGGTV
jgi:hypothetical protein